MAESHGAEPGHELALYKQGAEAVRGISFSVPWRLFSLVFVPLGNLDLVV
jgi:hypothetical protein